MTEVKTKTKHTHSSTCARMECSVSAMGERGCQIFMWFGLKMQSLLQGPGKIMKYHLATMVTITLLIATILYVFKICDLFFAVFMIVMYIFFSLLIHLKNTISQ